ncbi:hypothetical protein IJ425_00985 [bacterium]|nr:hypothetical protein [bacterium]
MTKAALLNRKETAISHGLELYSYLIAKEGKKKTSLYDFEKNYIIKPKDIGKYQTDENNLKTKDDVFAPSGKIIQLK